MSVWQNVWQDVWKPVRQGIDAPKGSGPVAAGTPIQDRAATNILDRAAATINTRV